MPLGAKGKNILTDFVKRYGKRGKSVMFATANKNPKLKAAIEGAKK